MRPMLLLVLVAISLGVTEAGKLSLQMTKSDSTLCPDQKTTCLSTSTCCVTTDGDYACCPFTRASCCSDRLHCCPEGFSCNLVKQQCFKVTQNVTIPWAEKQPAVLSDEAVRAPPNTICSDGSQCQGISSSCCKTFLGKYNCCPYPTNVCCSDGYHCCPQGTTCDAWSLRCLQTTQKAERKPLAVIKSSLEEELLALLALASDDDDDAK